MSTLTPAHKLLLTTFAVRRPLYWLPDEPDFSYDDWRKILGEEPFDVASKFLDGELIEISSLADHLSFVFRQIEGYGALYTLLIENNLPTEGDEHSIIQRLIQNIDSETLWNSVQEIKLVELSKIGIAIVNEYLTDMQRTHEQNFKKKFGVLPEKVKFVLSFVAGAAITGIIGNRMDAAFLAIIQTIKALFVHPRQSLEHRIDIGAVNETAEAVVLAPSQVVSTVTYYNAYDPFSTYTIALALIYTRLIDLIDRTLGGDQ